MRKKDATMPPAFREIKYQKIMNKTRQYMPG